MNAAQREIREIRIEELAIALVERNSRVSLHLMVALLDDEAAIEEARNRAQARDA